MKTKRQNLLGQPEVRLIFLMIYNINHNQSHFLKGTQRQPDSNMLIRRKKEEKKFQIVRLKIDFSKAELLKVKPL